ncbi:DarT ssDNA thymidine ADP-ribosyltransferase family protein [Ferrimonas sediminicola]|uniref:DarT ssDNA thymidine ADP-ribosyltransferase family protein n=1 Tax=Ferrimonas sediminicola TaxID=2569538 RepID=UPI0038994E76
MHFTDVRHLPSILQFGLMTRAQIAGLQTPVYPNDDVRLDGHPNSVSVSISFPNDRMLYKYRRQVQRQFAIVCLHPSVLWTHRTAFYPDNAANTTMRQLHPRNLMAPHSLEALFQDMNGVRSRADQCLEPCHTTNVQAEALVFGQIHPQFITRIVFNNQALLQQYNPYVRFAGKHSVLHGANSGYFGSRTFMLEH